MKRFAASTVLLWLILGSLPSHGAEKKLSLQAQELKSSLAVLKANPRDKSAQTQYLQKFPKDIQTFRRLFDPPDFSELYDGNDYIFALRDLEQDQPIQVGELLISLSKDAPQGADALSYLRQVTAKYAVSSTATFAKLLHSRSEKEISRVIRYLADVENHHYYPEYPLIIENLRKIGETKLAQQFEAAKKKRMKMPTHGEMRDEPTSAGGVYLKGVEQLPQPSTTVPQTL
mgnify:CR=1 FL=1